MIRARKRFGQHFLEPAWVDKVMRHMAPSPSDTFLEIGPGRGAMTRPLAAAAARVIAFEIDRDLASRLEGTSPNLIVVPGDFLDLTLASLEAVLAENRPARPSALRVAGNLPYNVASPILFKLLALYRAGVPLSDATLMLQREVADRLAAPPGTRTYGVLSVLIRHGADVDVLMRLPPGAFRPAPKVHSALVRLRFRPDRPAVADRVAFEALTQAVFTRRRKTLANALLAYPGAAADAIPSVLAALGIDGGRRPETLDIEELARLSDTFSRGEQA